MFCAVVRINFIHLLKITGSMFSFVSLFSFETSLRHIVIIENIGFFLSCAKPFTFILVIACTLAFPILPLALGIKLVGVNEVSFLNSLKLLQADVLFY